MESTAFPVRSSRWLPITSPKSDGCSRTDPIFSQGYSFGGRVSFEIAQQLVRAGERVSFLGLIDTGFRDTPVEGWSWVSEAVRLSRKVRRCPRFPRSTLSWTEIYKVEDEISI